MGPQLLNDLLHVLQLLWGEKRVIQKPVVGLPVLVLIPKQLNGTVKQLYHPKATKNIDKDLTAEYISQLWAEALQLYKSGQSIYIQDSQVLTLAEQEQRKHFDESPLQSDIYNFLEIPITPGWYTSSLEARRIHIRRCQEGDTSAGAYKRDKISVKEIACELFGYELNQPVDRRMSLEIARTLTALGWVKNGKKMRLDIYGVQWIYAR